MIFPKQLSYAVIGFLSYFPAASQAQTQREATGYNQLVAEVGAALEDGSGIQVGLVEGPSGAAYLPNTTEAEFTGKTFIDATGTNVGSSGHATIVSRSQFGNNTSLSPGVSTITGYEANDWVGRVLGFDSKTVPLTQNFAVMNHSYIANNLSIADATEYNRRIDFLVNRDNITMTVGANNGAASAVPQLWSHSYNTITVGLTNGNHSHGTTTFNGPGRIKPDIVAPPPPGAAFTSYSTPLVASAATVLRQQGMNSGNPNAIQNEVTKAVLMAGATKNGLPSWSNSSTQPLDGTFGAGELNIYNSYHIMEAVEFNGAATEPAASVSSLGWDYDDAIAAGQMSYYNVDLSSLQNEASILLTWNADVSDAGGVLDYDTLTLANLDLKLYNSTNSFLDSLIAESSSTVDNVEHLYLTNLSAGRYTFAVEGISGATDYGLAWRFTSVPEPSMFGLLACVSGLAITRYRRRTSQEAQ